ncbi:MAG: YraN family protein [Bacteroidetes bacterium]|nr:YraN family protein [Bacteroidota bacterium]
MGKNRETGTRGEQIAEDYLLAKGYTLLHRNWRTGHKEVDLIAEDDGLLVFLEIKTRSGLGFGYPEESVTEVKQNHLRTAAEAYLEQSSDHKTVRFDVISILLNGTTVAELRHIKDAF